jgi:ubiquinone/menaquinone biosynthesis C-methylase UbiE
MRTTEQEQEQNVSNAFSRQSENFDEIDKDNQIIQRMRKQVHEHVLSLLKTGDRILELNAGTGIDAIFFAQQGFEIYATDNAEGMLNVFYKKVKELNLEGKIKIQKCSLNNLNEIRTGSFNHIFSNFGGLNCAENIEQVIHQFDRLLKPNGIATLVIMPPVCPWEILLALKGNLKTAFRRLKKGGIPSHLEGIYFNTYYYSPKHLLKAFGKVNYSKISINGLGVLSPPPYLDKFPVNHPKLFQTLCKLEEKIDTYFPFNVWADHFIISMKKK